MPKSKRSVSPGEPNGKALELSKTVIINGEVAAKLKSYSLRPGDSASPSVVVRGPLPVTEVTSRATKERIEQTQNRFRQSKGKTSKIVKPYFDFEIGTPFRLLYERTPTLETPVDPDNTAIEYRKRLDLLDQFAAEFPGRPISEYAATLFPDNSKALSRTGGLGKSVAIPEIAPALWASDRRAGETPPDFIKRHYEPWLGQGLGRNDVRRLDLQLYNALSKWISRHGTPADFDLPKLKEANDRLLAQIDVEKPVLGDMTAREASRISMLRQRRKSDAER